MKLRTAALTLVTAAGMFSGACSPGPGGSTGAGGAGASGTGGVGGASCPDVSACGGDLVGTWTVVSSCLTVSGALDVGLVGAACPSAPVTGSLAVTGTFTANADRTYSDNTTTTGEEHFTLGPSCLVISSTPVTCDGAASIIKSLGYASLTCTPTAGGGCDCSGTARQTGGLGVLSVAPSTNSNYATAGNVVTISNDGANVPYSYCVSGDTLTLTPQSASPTMMGTIVLQRSGSSGTGGTTGSAGTTGSGGRGGAGGTAGAGGAAGAGGRGGAGGAAGDGGRGGAAGAPAQRGAAVAAARRARRALPGAAALAGLRAAAGARPAREGPAARAASSARATSTRAAATPASRPTAPCGRSSARTAESSIRSATPRAPPRTSSR